MCTRHTQVQNCYVSLVNEAYHHYEATLFTPVMLFCHNAYFLLVVFAWFVFLNFCSSFKNCGTMHIQFTVLTIKIFKNCGKNSVNMKLTIFVTLKCTVKYIYIVLQLISRSLFILPHWRRYMCIQLTIRRPSSPPAAWQSPFLLCKNLSTLDALIQIQSDGNLFLAAGLFHIAQCCQGSSML